MILLGTEVCDKQWFVSGKYSQTNTQFMKSLLLN